MAPWNVACQASLSMGFSRQEYWSDLPFPSPGDLPNSGIKPWSPTLQADSLPTELPGNLTTGEIDTYERDWACKDMAPLFLTMKSVVTCHTNLYSGKSRVLYHSLSYKGNIEP